MKLWTNTTTPEHVIASRVLHIEERRTTIKRMSSDWIYRQQAIEEISLCEREIIEAKKLIASRKAKP